MGEVKQSLVSDYVIVIQEKNQIKKLKIRRKCRKVAQYGGHEWAPLRSVTASSTLKIQLQTQLLGTGMHLICAEDWHTKTGPFLGDGGFWNT